MRFLDSAAVAALGPAAAVDAIRGVLLGGLDPALDPQRIPVDLDAGQFLLMPSQTRPVDGRDAGAAGVKVVTVAPANPARGLPRIQAVYLLYDHETLSLRAVLDGTALTTLRTPAVSVAAVLDHLPDHPLRLVVVGAGPQAVAHAETLAAVRRVARTSYLVRDPGRAPVDALALGTAAADDALRGADVVVCATSARTPVLDSSLLRDDTVVVAVGSHEPDARELDAALMARATVVVEDRATALREAGDVVMAVAEGALAEQDLVPLRDLVAGTAVAPTGRPLVFKSVGMSWQDLVVARAVVDRSPSR
ncbi:ornithine cyclodeaminase family protein [Nocardioides iriomotensis]|uniref:Ornithine cyclodeaminase family protein n=1 Tax=Nocardioides iriomotensis TaxID=715784 RepID=A0A4Q5IX30_9ACTN|nr:ornithine cyclodeaminase family protein [Nocardioides iriomotensis]RYU10652.1 ornithine cyclodeaminase family protein [Nocardioides iriomotensis]